MRSQTEVPEVRHFYSGFCVSLSQLEADLRDECRFMDAGEFMRSILCLAVISLVEATLRFGARR